MKDMVRVCDACMRDTEFGTVTPEAPVDGRLSWCAAAAAQATSASR